MIRPSHMEEDMTEFLGTGGGQIAGEVTGLTAAAEEVVATGPDAGLVLVLAAWRAGDRGLELGVGTGSGVGEPAAEQR